MDGIKFEQAVAEALRSLGWSVRETPISGDYGADLVLSDEKEKWVVQCKFWTASVPYAAVQEVYAARRFYRARGALVVSKAGFTKQAVNGAKKLKVTLLKFAEILPGCDLDRNKKDTYSTYSQNSDRYTYTGYRGNYGAGKSAPPAQVIRVSVKCDICAGSLALPKDRAGYVQCPLCGGRFFARTRW